MVASVVAAGRLYRRFCQLLQQFRLATLRAISPKDIDAHRWPSYSRDGSDAETATLPDLLIDNPSHLQNFQHQHQPQPEPPNPPLHTTMAKRKRASASPSPDAPERALKSQKRICNRCIADAKKSLVAALRLGAGFERQKHSRRKKTAQAKKDTKVLERLDAEYTILKGLDLEKVADQHLRKTVARVKSLKDQEALRSWVEGVEKGSQEGVRLRR
jgi:hypothetical protein